MPPARLPASSRDHRHLFAGVRGNPAFIFPQTIFIVGRKPFQGTDGNGFIDFTAPAGFFTGMDTHPAQNAWKGNFLANNGMGLIGLARANHS
jgi:hypothetical protein